MSRSRAHRFRIWKLVPSMYQRRLLVVVMGGLCALVLPMLQVTRLTVAKGPELREQAEKRLVNENWIRTIRGRIVDRQGRVLAEDRASFDVAIDYPVLTGKWAYTEAARRARRLNPNWNELAPEQREELVNRLLPEFESKLDQMWETLAMVSGVPRSELEERRVAIVDQVRSLAATVTEAQRKALESELNKGEAISATDDADGEAKRVGVKTADVKQKIAEEKTWHTVLADVPDAVGFRVRQLAESAGDAGDSSSPLPGVRVIDSVRREYPLETMDVPVETAWLPGPLRHPGTQTVRVSGVATHVLGWVREKFTSEDILRRQQERLRRAGKEPPVLPPGLSPSDKAEAAKAVAEQTADMARRLGSDRGQYFPGDPVGVTGIEGAFEYDLRGVRGVRTRRLDTEEVVVSEPTHGQDVPLTLDVMLQARLQALFDPSLGLAVEQPWHKAAANEEGADKPHNIPYGTPLNGAIVVLDVATGGILAMVSAPSFTRGALKTEPSSFWQDPYRNPYLNRATGGWYTPGSIVKPLMLCAAEASGKLADGERIECTGHYFKDKPTIFRCWKYKLSKGVATHNDVFGHSPNGAEAIAGSCNIYFFDVGKRLGTRGIGDWYTKFGVGAGAEHWNLGIGQENPGKLPADPAKSTIDEAILMGIGQGPVAWTPLHAADAYATIARGGTRIIPRIRLDAPVRRIDLGISQQAAKTALEGLFGSANLSNGTTYTISFIDEEGVKRPERIFTHRGITVWAKSGTADVVPFKADLTPGGGNNPAVYDGDHAWCVALCGVDHPEYAIACVIDYGGSGGRCAAPVVNCAIRALVGEGYLPNVKAREADEGPADESN